MTTRPPVIRPISWWAAAFHVLLYATAVLAALAWFGRGSIQLAIGVLPLIAYSFGSRYFVARRQRRGMQLIKAQQYDAAIQEFQASYEFFSRHPWIDRLRAVVLLCSSAISYREMALVNIAFCHSQAGRGAEAKAAYERTLAEFPESSLAQAATRMIAAAENIVPPDRTS